MKMFNIKVFCDGADKKSILDLASKDWISGFTTNPTLMRKAGIQDYKAFALDILSEIKELPISFEVFSDEFDEMYEQALEITSWGHNTYVKIPITNTRGESSIPLIKRLTEIGVKINATAIFTLDQVFETAQVLKDSQEGVISIFAGRIADTGRDPMPMMKAAVNMCYDINHKLEVLWASPRELLNIMQAEEVGCHIITVPPDILSKMGSLNKDLTQFSLETVKMFYKDAQAAGYKI